MEVLVVKNFSHCVFQGPIRVFHDLGEFKNWLNREFRASCF